MVAAVLFALAAITRGTLAVDDSSAWRAVSGGSWREGVVGQPVAINPLISDNAADLDLSTLIYSSLSDLAESYEVSEDGTEYTVKLREGIVWDNNQPITSDDVVFTVETVQDPTTRSPLTKNWKGVVTERVSELRVIFTLPAPYAFFKENMERLPVLPVHLFGGIPKSNFRLSSYNLEPVGSGPYRLEDFSKRRDGFISEYHLVRNERFFGSKPFIKDFYFVFYESRELMMKDFALRKIQGFGSLSPVDTASLPLRNAVVDRIPMPGYYALFFNENLSSSLKNNGLRRALALAIDKREIVAQVFHNEAEVVHGPLGKWGAGETLAESENLNPEELKKENITLTLIVPQVDFLEETARIIKEDWLTAGVRDVNIISLPTNELLENVVKTNNYEVLLFGNVLENPLDLFPFWHSSERFYPGLNLALYKNQKVDTLIEKVRQSDENGMLDLAKEAEKFIVEDNPAVFLFSLPYTYVHSKNLGGFQFENENRPLVEPSDRFQKVEEWHLSKARVVK